jgi:hypothetical protein
MAVKLSVKLNVTLNDQQRNFRFLFNIALSVYLWLYSPCGTWPIFMFFNPYTVCRIPWTGDQHIARSLLIHKTTQIQNKCTHISMPRVWFEPTVTVLERAQTVHALDLVAIVIGSIFHYALLIGILYKKQWYILWLKKFSEPKFHRHIDTKSLFPKITTHYTPN